MSNVLLMFETEAMPRIVVRKTCESKSGVVKKVLFFAQKRFEHK